MNGCDVYKEDGTKYEIKDKTEVTTNTNLYLLPVKSKKFPSFKGLYFTYPSTSPYGEDQPEFYRKPFNNANELKSITKIPNIDKNTIMTSSRENMNFLKGCGFPNVYNIDDFKGDVWTINGNDFILDVKNDKYDFYIQSSVKNRKFNFFHHLPADSYYLNIVGSDFLAMSRKKSSSIVVPYIIVGNFTLCTEIYEIEIPSGAIAMGSPGAQYTRKEIFDTVWGGKYPDDEGSICIRQNTNNGVIKIYKDIVMMNNSQIVGSGIAGLDVYKNIIMMNNAKIYNEDGTEYNIESEVT